MTDDSSISPLGKRFQHFTPSPFHFFDQGEEAPAQADSQDAPEPEARPPGTSSWDRDTEEYFNDFLSIDSDAISQSLLQLEEKKRFDKKYRESKQEKQLEEKTRALSQAFQEIWVSAAESQAMLEAARAGLAEIQALLQQLCPVTYPYFDCFSYHTLAILKASGFKDDVLQHLVFFNYFLQHGTFLLGRGSYLHLQMGLFYLDIPVSEREMTRYVERHFASLEQVEQLVQYLLRYLRLNGRCFNAVSQTLKERSAKVLPYFLLKVQRPRLDLSKRLAFKNLENRIKSLKNQLVSIQLQLSYQETNQQPTAFLLGEKAPMFRQWAETEYNICCILILFHLAGHGYPLPLPHLRRQMEEIGIRTAHPVIAARLQGFTLEELESLVLEMRLGRPLPPATPEPPEVPVPAAREQMDLTGNDLKSIDNWTRYKEQQVLSIREHLYQTHQHYAGVFFSHYSS